MSTRRRLGIVLGVAAIVVMLWLSVRGGLISGGGRGWVELSFESMATVVSVTVPDGPRAREAAEIVSDVFGKVDLMMSEWKPGSPLTAVNEAAGERAVEVPPELLRLIEEGIRIGEATDGAFDITWAALWGLWDFKAEEPGVPDEAEIRNRVKLVDFRRVEVDREAGTVYLPETGMKIGLGAIAKGYALDVAAERLRETGFSDFLIVSGGQVYAAGARDGRAWRVGIRDPRGGPGDQIGVIELRDASASTSGDYERFFEVGGVRYHHILDPRTGWPSEGARSVTVVSQRAMLADALSTAGMILGADGAPQLAAEFEVWALLVDEEGRLSTHGHPARFSRMLVEGQPPGP